MIKSTFQHLLNKDKSITIHARNIQLLATEMYKTKNGNLPCSLLEFVTPREISYNLGGGGVDPIFYHIILLLSIMALRPSVTWGPKYGNWYHVT